MVVDDRPTLLCWHSARAGADVLKKTLNSPRMKKLHLGRVIYLMQVEVTDSIRAEITECMGAEQEVEYITLEIDDPTHHQSIYEILRDQLLPKLLSLTHLHINISPGTPAMHAVWLMLYAGGRFPKRTKMWSSQFDPKTKRHRIDPIDFKINTFMAEVSRHNQSDPLQPTYDLEPYSIARLKAFDRLKRYAQVAGAPLLILGERGVGKTQLVESIVKTFKQRPNIKSIACGGLDSELADSLLFGHKKGAFTGATEDRDGMIKSAHQGILFLDEIQDLPKSTQRRLIRVLQDKNRRYHALGSDKEETMDVELVCASNQPLHVLKEKLDADFFDRISQLMVEIPPLRECREDLRADWSRVWRATDSASSFSSQAPMNDELLLLFKNHPFYGNIRDLQRIAILIVAWAIDHDIDKAIQIAITEWQILSSDKSVANFDANGLGQGTRKERLDLFKYRLADWAKNNFNDLSIAAKSLDCTVRTLTNDLNHN